MGVFANPSSGLMNCGVACWLGTLHDTNETTNATAMINRPLTLFTLFSFLLFGLFGAVLFWDHRPLSVYLMAVYKVLYKVQFTLLFVKNCPDYFIRAFCALFFLVIQQSACLVNVLHFAPFILCIRHDCPLYLFGHVTQPVLQKCD